jgi:hypothetical protein
VIKKGGEGKARQRLKMSVREKGSVGVEVVKLFFREHSFLAFGFVLLHDRELITFL